MRIHAACRALSCQMPTKIPPTHERTFSKCRSAPGSILTRLSLLSRPGSWPGLNQAGMPTPAVGRRKFAGLQDLLPLIQGGISLGVWRPGFAELRQVSGWGQTRRYRRRQR